MNAGAIVTIMMQESDTTPLRAAFLQAFKKAFGENPHAQAEASGRVNLLGEHTDYNNGMVLPMQIPQKLRVCMSVAVDAAAGGSGALRIFSMNEPDEDVIMRSLSDGRSGHWSDYALGTLREAFAAAFGGAFSEAGFSALLSIAIGIQSEVPVGAGVSSSAALEVAVIRALQSLCARHAALFGDAADAIRGWDALAVAKIAQWAENHFVGMPCGLMDQLSVSAGDSTHALFIDFLDPDNIAYKKVSLFAPEVARFCVLNSGISHRLLSSGDEGYKTRRAQCEEAARQLGVANLSRASEGDWNKLSDPVLVRRARHIICENRRVRESIAALEKNDAAAFGRLMNESHESQKDDFSVSIPEIDDMVAIARAQGALGARLTGGGFGGSIVFMSRPDDAEKICAAIRAAHPASSRVV